MVCTVLASYPGHLFLVGGGGVWHACHFIKFRWGRGATLHGSNL